MAAVEREVAARVAGAAWWLCAAEVDLARAAADLARGRTAAEADALLGALGDWMAAANVQNYDGVTLTPGLLAFLARPGDVHAKLAELDALRAATRAGRFDPDNALQARGVSRLSPLPISIEPFFVRLCVREEAPRRFSAAGARHHPTAAGRPGVPPLRVGLR